MTTTAMTLPLCKCGCGEQVKLARGGKPNSYLKGHARRGQQFSDLHRQRLSVAARNRDNPGPWLGKKMPESARKKMSIAKKGKPLRPEHRAKIAASMKGKPHPSIHHKQSFATRLKKKLTAKRGAESHSWRGGVSSANALARTSFELRVWKQAVFRRDNYTCQHCNARSRKGRRVVLNAHHIKPFATFIELRYVVSNGLTLCKQCHDKLHGR